MVRGGRTREMPVTRPAMKAKSMKIMIVSMRKTSIVACAE
jgi:hypothetical protein